MSRYLVRLSSKIISNEWWGQQWCQNISRYADYMNRLERGRTYIRKGAVQEIEIDGGHIKANVTGTRPLPYSVDIHIRPADEDLINKSINKIKDIEQLKDGVVPDNCRELFSVEKGLFPSSREIEFSCSCPDDAALCKHIIAVLYAIGSILDQEPLLLFQLRGIDVEKYLDKRLVSITNEILVDIHNHRDEDRLIDDDLISSMFVIEIETENTDDYGSIQQKNPDIKSDDVRIIELRPKPKKKERPIPKVRPAKNPIEGYVIRQYDKDGKFLREYKTFQEVEDETNRGVLNIKRAISGLKKSAGGYQWRKETENTAIGEIEPIILVSSGEARPIAAYTDAGVLVAQYSSIKDAERNTGVNSKSIRDAAKGVQKHAGGFVWKYL